MSHDPLSARLLLLGLLITLVGLTFQSTWAQPDPVPGQDDQSGDGQTTALPTLAAGGTADSNGRMIAVTGVDVTGQSILYLIDTIGHQICVYQASGGSSSTQGIRFVGARRIDLDLLLDGFNDKTESGGKPLAFKDLQAIFESQGRSVEGR